MAGLWIPRDRYAHVLRCDIFRYFPAIDHAVLKGDLRRRISVLPVHADIILSPFLI